MEIYEDTLSKDSVSIKSDKYGMRVYYNSTRGRAQLETECTADIVKKVEATWGSTPTVAEPTYPTPTAPSPTAEQQQLAAMALVQAQQTSIITELQQTNAALMLKLAGGNK